ncbi:hypothetical protein OW763_04630 [Clostridium aestuarii]|uniref:DUF2232 domain-containing protein n=1 Tax=Clostridium aestuarii TaxID=338193 RepID=A0ABT4CZ22_9CLOT|nr:hypothetical protein [Clostridium aestuarii]MCY6483637.1 hypothetical protein [Clostridium aestuarii]
MKKAELDLERAKKIKKIALLTTIMAALFLALSPQYFGALLPILFIVPIFMGIHGIKAGKKSGMYLGMGIIPISLAISVMWIRYFFSIFGNLYKELNNMSFIYNISISTSKFFLTASVLMSFALFTVCIAVFLEIIRNRSVFK